MKPLTAVLLVIGIEILLSALAVFLHNFTLEGLQATTRFSGRFSLLLFSFIFLLYPWNNGKLAQCLSAQYFLVFAIAHGIHLIILLNYVSLAGIPLLPHRLAGGFLAYAIIFAMPWFQRRELLGKMATSRLTSIGYVYLFYVWFIFFMTYVARINKSFPNAGGTYEEHAILMTWVVLMLVIKLIILLRRPVAA